MSNGTDNGEITDPEHKRERTERELTYLFGDEVVSQSRMVDVVDIKFNDEMTRCISQGVTGLKKLKGQPQSQRELVRRLAPGEQLVLCMWIMEMDLLDKIQEDSYLQRD